MSKLNVDQKSIKELLESKKSDFMIPDYQRPYAWQDSECLTLWEDIFAFAFPENNSDNFNSDEEYYLGPIVTFKNDAGKMEVIDGQQRLTTIMLLLRAFYSKFGNMQDERSKATRSNIEKCLWKTDEFGRPDMTALKIDSEVATDNDKEEFLEILKTGVVETKHKSNYANNFRFFQSQIQEFLNLYPNYFALMPTRILNNCILLPIEASDQNTALRIFSTLNDRGKPLSDADIFKAQFYKYYSKKGEKELFISKWKELEEVCEKIFKPLSGTPMDELFTRYMYYERAKLGIKSSTTEALRKFYERDSYSLLNKDETLENLMSLAAFWKDVIGQNEDRFSEDELKKLFVLSYAPNGMWTYFTSVYFMANKKEDGTLDTAEFVEFLNKMTAFIWAYAITNPGVNALRTPVYAEMVRVINGESIAFEDFKFDINDFENIFNNYAFNNGRPITKSILAWWAYRDANQKLISHTSIFEIEHIYAKNRYDKEKSLQNVKNLESLGNKSMLEKGINIRASDYKFTDKVKYYLGYTNSRGQKKEGTVINELYQIGSTENDFTDSNIELRSDMILSNFVAFLNENGLTK